MSNNSELPPIVNFAAVDFWYHNRSHSEIQLMTRLSHHTKVLFVNSIGMRAPLPGRSTNVKFRIWRKVKSLLRGLRRPLPTHRDFYVFTPVIIPAYSTPWLRRLNFIFIRVQVRLVMLVLRIKKPIIMETIPTANEVAPHLPHCLEIIYRADKMSAFGEADQEYIAQCEEKQIRRANRTFYTSQTLLEEEEKWHHGKGQFLDHGVDLVQFVPRLQDEERPEELAYIDTPIIGFFGGLDDYVIDFDLLEKIANEFPECALVLIGEATCDISAITNKSNVAFLGFRSVEEVAILGAHFDVAILPRLNDDWTKYTNPIKIKEYLALGLDVVTMDIPEVRRYSPALAIAHNHEEFINEIRIALKKTSTPVTREHLVSLVAEDTWDYRCDEVIADINELLSAAQ